MFQFFACCLKKRLVEMAGYFYFIFFNFIMHGTE